MQDNNLSKKKKHARHAIIELVSSTAKKKNKKQLISRFLFISNKKQLTKACAINICGAQLMFLCLE